MPETRLGYSSDGRLALLNEIRTRIPYAYWLLYDVVIGSSLTYGALRLSRVFVIGLLFLAVAVFFDGVELIVKWKMGLSPLGFRRRSEVSKNV